MHGGEFRNKRVLPTTQNLGDVARTYLTDLEKRMQTRPLEVFDVWPQVAGEFARMTRAKKFEHGVLYVVVNNSTLLSVLHQRKAVLLAALRAKCLEIQVMDIMFRFG